MRPVDVLRLLLLSAIWGASYLFMRVAAPSFGPVPLILLRVGCAALFFSPLLARRGVREQLARHWRALAVVGIFNSAFPFSLLAFSTLSLEAGFTSLLNATTPLFAAAVGALWLALALRRGQILGLVLGFAGVAILSWGHLSFRQGGSGWAIVAALVASLSYGVSAHITKHYLSGLRPVVVATGSMIGS
ncbi:MAG: DMT family transporter [bacterium]|nr:DMT family transporter [bacterium]